MKLDKQALMLQVKTWWSQLHQDDDPDNFTQFSRWTRVHASLHACRMTLLYLDLEPNEDESIMDIFNDITFLWEIVTMQERVYVEYENA